MDRVSLDNTFPIKSKIAYAKILYLSDKTRNKPLLKKQIRGSTDEESIYDSAIYYVWTKLNKISTEKYNLKFTSTKGKVDDILQLHPFDPNSKFHDPDPSAKYMHQIWEVPIDPTDLTSENVVVVAHYYNGFQKDGGEWAGVRTDQNTEELRLTVDFVSLLTKQGKENDLFEQKPTAYLVNEKNIENQVDLDFEDKRKFSVKQNSVKKGQVLKLVWKIKWDNIAELKGKGAPFLLRPW
jgi:hypothetical protein